MEKSISSIKDPNVQRDVFNKLMATTVIHEIGHGMGIDHHREGLKEPTTNTVEGGDF